jgi:L-aspartate oxidase
MGSNSLLEGLVLGQRLGRVAGVDGYDVRRGAILEPDGCGAELAPDAVTVNIQDVTYSLKSLMWRQLGVVREESKLADALPKIELWTHAVERLAPSGRATWELRNMLEVARLAVIGARERRESRGVHFRSDHPEPDTGLEAHTLLRARGDLLELEGVEHSFEPVGGAVEVA